MAAPDENGWSNIELPKDKEIKWKNIGTEKPEGGGFFEVKNAALSAALQAGRLALSKQQLEAFALPYRLTGTRMEYASCLTTRTSWRATRTSFQLRCKPSKIQGLTYGPQGGQWAAQRSALQRGQLLDYLDETNI